VTELSTLKDYIRYEGIKNVIRETYVPNPAGASAEANLPSGTSSVHCGPGAVIPAH
jgi:hypothetical protein